VKVKYNDELTIEWADDFTLARVFVGDTELEYVTAVRLNNSVGRLESGFFSELTLSFGIGKAEVLDEE